MFTLNVCFQKIFRPLTRRELEIPEERGQGVDGPGNSEGERGFKAKFTSRWLGKLLIFHEFVLTP